MNRALAPEGYAAWLRELKLRIQGARQRAVLAAASEQVRLYHHIGREILDRQRRQGWGAKVIDRLAADLRDAFPDTRGYSARNLKYMRQFAGECPDLLIGQQPAAQLPWFHIVTLLVQVREPEVREWYARETLTHGWSRQVLTDRIRGKLHLRQGAAVTNFERRLPDDARLAAEILKDPYHFDFLGLGDEAAERDIERALIRHITRFLLELGAGFAFVGRQFRLEIDGQEFFVDLLLYHTRVKCFVVVELKASEFEPEHAGKLNFYLSAVDHQVRARDDKPTIGLLLCKHKNRLVAEFALSGIDRPIGVAENQLVRALPEPLDRSLPTIEEIEAALTLALERDELDPGTEATDSEHS